jgi:hypothetical protein
MARLVGRQRPVGALLQNEPVDPLVLDLPDDVLLHPAPPVDPFLVVQVVRCATMSHLYNQLRRAFNVVVLTDSRLPTRLLVDSEQGIRLRLVVQVKANRGVVAD